MIQEFDQYFDKVLYQNKKSFNHNFYNYGKFSLRKMDGTIGNYIAYDYYRRLWYAFNSGLCENYLFNQSGFSLDTCWL